MNIIIERAALLRSLGHVQSVVERRSTIPILSNVLMRARENQLSLAATDMDLEIIETAPARVTVAGGITAPAHTLFDIVRKLPDGSEIQLETIADGAVLVLRAGRSTFRLPCLPVEDFPQLSGASFPVHFDISAATLRGLIDRTRFAISTEETRYYLNGIYLHAAKIRVDGGEYPVLRAVATDGHRLARVETPLPDGAEGMPGVILPRKTVGEIRKLIDEAADLVSISLSETKVRFQIDTVTVTSKLIDGSFPDYERVIPSGNNKVLEVRPKEFAAAVDRVATISTEKSRAVKVRLEKNMVTVSATSPEAGHASEELEGAYSDSQLEIGFNSRYLLDIVQQIESDAARFILADAAAPTIIKDGGDESALYVLMPMRV